MSSLLDRQTDKRQAIIRFRSAAGDRYEAAVHTSVKAPGLVLRHGFALGSLPEVVFLTQSPQRRRFDQLRELSWAYASCRGNHDP